MIESKVTFYSDGLRLAGSVYRPDDNPTGPSPALVVCSGYQGVNEFYPKMFAADLTRRGYVCVGFDYRGFAHSEGDSGRVLIEEQVADIRNAVTFAQSLDDIDHRRLGLVGWGMGAANVVLAAERSGNVAAVAALNGFYDGGRWLRAVHSYDDWTRIVRSVADDRERRVLTGESELCGPFEHYPLDPATKEYVEQELAHLFGFGRPTRLQFTESLIDLKVEPVVARLRNIPIFVGHGLDNTLHPFSEAEALFEAAPSTKVLYRIAGRHNDFMYPDNPVFTALCDELERFFDDAFRASAHPSPTTTG